MPRGNLSTHFAALAGGVSRLNTNAAIVAFMADIWGVYDSRAYTFMGTKGAGGQWRDHPIRGRRERKVARILEKFPADRNDIYFCPNAFSERHRKTEFALPSRYAWCDIDDANPDGYDPQPSILWETSPGHFQGIWIWDANFSGEVAQGYSRSIVYKDGGDKNGWSITKMLRVPGTLNHKPEYKLPVVTLRSFDATRRKLPKSILSYGAAKPKPTARKRTASTGSVDPLKHDPDEVMAKYRKKVRSSTCSLVTAGRVIGSGRFMKVHRIALEYTEAGASDDEVAAVVWRSIYFQDKWYGDFNALEREVAKARSIWEARQ